jgi:ankyrin repeat protein
MFRRIALLSVIAVASLSVTGCATLVSSQHQTEDYTPLFASASAGDVATVQSAIAQDRSALTATEWDHATLLHVAVQQNHSELTRALIGDGANVNALTDDRLSPLHMAAQNGNVTISRLLLEHGAQINPVDLNGWTPLDRADKWQHPLTATFLRACGGKEAGQL